MFRILASNNNVIHLFQHKIQHVTKCIFLKSVSHSKWHAGNLSECSGRQRFSGTDLVEIAKRNNVSKRTIYRYKAYYEEMKEAESEK